VPIRDRTVETEVPRLAPFGRIEVRGFSGTFQLEVPALPRVDQPDPPICRIVLTK